MVCGFAMKNHTQNIFSCTRSLRSRNWADANQPLSIDNRGSQKEFYHISAVAERLVMSMGVVTSRKHNGQSHAACTSDCHHKHAKLPSASSRGISGNSHSGASTGLSTAIRVRRRESVTTGEWEGRVWSCSNRLESFECSEVQSERTSQLTTSCGGAACDFTTRRKMAALLNKIGYLGVAVATAGAVVNATLYNGL